MTVTTDGTNIIINDGVETLTSINQVLNNPSLLEQLLTKEWLLKGSIYVNGPDGILYINNYDCDVLKMKGLPSPIMIRAQNGASIFIDNTNITGWDVTNNIDISLTTASPAIQSYYNNTLNVTNTYFKHAYIYYFIDETPDTVDNCTFFESNPNGVKSYLSLYKTITHNKFYDNYIGSYEDTTTAGGDPNDVDFYTYTNFSYNYAIGHKGYSIIGENVRIGAGSTIIGNEVIYSGWNMVEVLRDTISKNNIVHDNGGNHNGFNHGAQAWDRYFYNDYTYNIYPYSGFYFQTCVLPHCEPKIFPYRNYIINGKAENNGSGFKFMGGYDSYIYNFTAINNGNIIMTGSGNNHIRKSRMSNSTEYPGFYAMGFFDYEPAEYRYFDNASMIDTVFKNNLIDIYINLNGNNQVITLVNTYNEGSGTPSVSWEWSSNKGELREYVYLDVLVQDKNGNPIPGATVTIGNLNDTNYPAINLTLPPPPPDLISVPETPLPLPKIQNLTSITTRFDGHTPLPNYGWSESPEPTTALMFQKRTSSGTVSGYVYKVTASWNGSTATQTVTPDKTWYRINPSSYQNTLILQICPVLICDFTIEVT